MNFSRLRLVVLAAALAGGCRDHAARPIGARSGVFASTINVAVFPQDAAVAASILRMPFDEVAERLGSLSFEARSFFVFNRGGEEREQTHLGRLTQDASGNFYVFSDTGPSQLELYLIGESVLVRQDKGNLRKKPRREANTEFWRELVWSSVRQSLGVFSPRLRFVDPRPDTAAGHQATRYRVALAPEGEVGVEIPPEAAELPKSPTSRWRELARPLALSGSMWIDAATGVMLKVKIEGRLEVADRDVRPTQVTLRFDAAVTKPGTVAAITAPEGITEYERTPPPGDPIGFFRADLEQAGPAAVLPATTSAPAHPPDAAPSEASPPP